MEEGRWGWCMAGSRRREGGREEEEEELVAEQLTAGSSEDTSHTHTHTHTHTCGYCGCWGAVVGLTAAAAAPEGIGGGTKEAGGGTAGGQTEGDSACVPGQKNEDSPGGAGTVDGG